MAEILIKAIDAIHTDAVKDRRGCYKRGMPVVVMPDGHIWGLEERLPKFIVIKIPLVSVDRVLKYIGEWRDIDNRTVLQRRRWRIRWADLPLAARNKLQSTGELTIKATNAYTGAFDYTWVQIRDYFRNDETLANETGVL